MFEKNAKFAWICKINIRLERNFMLVTDHFKLYLETILHPYKRTFLCYGWYLAF